MLLTIAGSSRPMSAKTTPVSRKSATFHSGVASVREAGEKRRYQPWLSHRPVLTTATTPEAPTASARDRKSTRLNSSHANILYAVFCLQKKKQMQYWLEL